MHLAGDSAALAILLVTTGCGDRPAEGTAPPTAATSPAAASPAATPPSDLAAQPPVDAPASPSRIRKELGDPALAVVEKADASGAARMRVIAAAKSQDDTLATDVAILGYPFDGSLVPLDAAARAELLHLILDDDSYAWGLANRCLNDYFVGVRFQRGPERVEFALGVRCMQALWASRAEGEVQRAGAVMKDEPAEAVLKLLAGAGVRGVTR